MTIRVHETTLLLAGALLLAGSAAAGPGDGPDGVQKKGQIYGTTSLDEAELSALFDRALASCCAQGTCTEVGGCAAPCAGCQAGECSDPHPQPAGAKLVSYVARSPAALATLRPRIEAGFLAEDAPAERRGMLLELLAYCESEDSVACSETLYAARPAAFGEDQLLVFAQRSPAFEKGLAKLVKQGHVRAAAFFAHDGQHALAKRARVVLARAAGVDRIEPGNAADALMAAAALGKLGEPERLPAVRERVVEGALAALDAGDLAGARRIALTAEFLSEPRYGKGYVGAQMKAYLHERSKEVATADEVFQLIERIAPM